jgi:metal-dependent amidase/aminoacylase/carboxypeptidase family protein
MAHPGPVDLPYLPCLASASIDVRYSGRAAHASAAPHLGVNAADALTVAQVAIGLLRQHLLSTHRVHGITRHAGDAANVIPDRAEARYLVRAATMEDVEALEDRVRRCFDAGALATGATVEIAHSKPVYSHLDHDVDLTAAYVRNAAALGRAMDDLHPSVDGAAASTDMANVSLALPAIHPVFDVGTTAMPHHPDFTAAANTASAHRAALDVGLTLAWTALDAATSPLLRERLLQR